ncbi:MAG: hypothetical protein K0B87_05875 [Candidatus Syntrophosphaera sp.]|nr:hypothetical protein [Candidatus Syntrophosphaera sp.]
MLNDSLSFSPEELRQILEEELGLHPQARLVDLYKLLNQSHYGPTHIDPDPDKIARNLRRELNSITEHAGNFWQDIGCGRGFYRINLVALISMPKIPFSRFTSFSDYMSERFRKVGRKQIDILTQSLLNSRCAAGIDPENWHRIWKDALPLVLEFIKPTATEQAELDQYIHNDQIPSHSKKYRELYSPHYRVIHHTQLSNFPNLARP